MINSKKKGNAWENNLVNWLMDNGIKAWKDSQSGGGDREKGDIGNNIDMTMESKASKNIKLMDWWKQVEKSADTHKNSPVLFIHKDGMGEQEWLVVMNNDNWIELVKDSQGIKVEKTVELDSRSLKYKRDRAVQSVKELLKELEVYENS